MNTVAQPPASARTVPRTLGMWVFIASELLFFGALLAAYLAGRLHWPHGFGAASRHTHVVLGTRDGHTRGGHLIDARVRPTLEVMLEESPRNLQRVHDADSGLALIRIEGSL